MFCLLICTLSCRKGSEEAAAPEMRNSASSDDTTIEEQIAMNDIAISIIGWTDSTELPKTIRVRYENKLNKRGYFELPGPMRGKLHSEYAIPSLTVGLEPVGDQFMGGGGFSCSHRQKPSSQNAEGSRY
jgi:hypothetical protein